MKDPYLCLTDPEVQKTNGSGCPKYLQLRMSTKPTAPDVHKTYSSGCPKTLRLRMSKNPTDPIQNTDRKPIQILKFKFFFLNYTEKHDK